MPKKTSLTGSELFIVDNSDEDWKAVRYLRDWCQISKSIDIATGYFEIGAFLALGSEWQKVDSFRLLMGDEVSRRTKKAFDEGLERLSGRLDQSIEAEKRKNDFLEGVAAIVEAIQSGKVQSAEFLAFDEDVPFVLRHPQHPVSLAMQQVALALQRAKV